uniref:Putative secreted protein n=1 Tax=Anopheles darlingi TaxID=43151 RepID=A0A2M4D4Y6_ANODA
MGCRPRCCRHRASWHFLLFCTKCSVLVSRTAAGKRKINKAGIRKVLSKQCICNVGVWEGCAGLTLQKICQQLRIHSSTREVGAARVRFG